MKTTTEPQTLALHGGPKALAEMTGRAEPKIGVEEFLSIARRFGFNDAALDRIAHAISNDDLPEGGPTLSRYATANPKPAFGELYEAKARALFGVAHAMPVSSGTGALHAAIVGVGAKPGDQVICPALGFIATSAAMMLAGVKPVFCDVDESLQIDPSKIEACITDRTVAVVPTHHWGTVADMAGVRKVAAKHGLKVIEDCAQSPGGQFDGQFVGTIGDIGCFSISAYKIIGGGEGGMFITNHTGIFEHAAQLAEGGGLWRPNRFAPPRYEGELFVGGNYRLSELESAVNLVQLDKLLPLVERHRRVSRRILSQIAAYRRIRPQLANDPEGDIGYQIRFFPDSHDLADKITQALRAEGIAAGHRGADHGPDWHLYSHMFPVWHDLGEQIRHTCPVADDLYGRMVSMPVNQWWSDEDCDAVAAGMNKVFAAYDQKVGEPGTWPAIKRR